MRIAILDDHADKCTTCERLPVLYQPDLNRFLERDVKAMLQVKWYSKGKYKWACNEIDRICKELRLETAYGITEPRGE